MQGADTESLRRVAADLTRLADRLRDAQRTVDQCVRDITWTGPDAKQFQQDWRSRGGRQLTSADESLRGLAKTLLNNAARQDETSATLGDDGLRSAAGRAGAAGADAVGRVNDEVFERNTQNARRDEPATPGSRPADGKDFTVGPPSEPAIKWDEGFEYGAEEPTWRDRLELEKWRVKAEGAAVLGLDDGAAMYLHYLSNTGEDLNCDLGEAYKEDSGMRNSINWEMANTAAAADRMATSDGTVDITGPANPGLQYPTSENWQKAVGGHQEWSSATVTREGDTITMVVTVHAEDHYNFNPNQQDIASGTPDDVNGRFTTVGLAKPFDSHGTYTRTITWQAGNPPDADSFN